VYTYGPPVEESMRERRANVRPRQIAPTPITIHVRIASRPYGASAAGER
jgi:hypothetical protein